MWDQSIHQDILYTQDILIDREPPPPPLTIQSGQKFCGTYDLFQLAVIVKQKIGVLHVWYVCTKAKNIKLTPREDFSIFFLSLIAGHQLFILVRPSTKEPKCSTIF